MPEPTNEEILTEARNVRAETLSNERLQSEQYDIPVRLRGNFFYTVRFSKSADGSWDEGDVLPPM